jgi:hypothetical protein
MIDAAQRVLNRRLVGPWAALPMSGQTNNHRLLVSLTLIREVTR